MLLLIPLLGLAAEPTATNADLAYAVCVHCHGAHGEGRPELWTPRIGDLDASYVAAQLTAYRDGQRSWPDEARGASAMAALARGLDDEAVAALSTTVAAMEPELLPPGPPSEAGAAAWAPCVACHGEDARGNEAMQAPSLLYQEPGYLRAQLKSYRDGLRGGEGDAPLALSMAAMAQGLDDATIDALVDHVASLRPPLPPLVQPEVTATKEEGLEAFADIYAVSQHPRCMNCHPAGDAPLQTDASRPHILGITRFSPLDGVHCSTCHAARPAGDGLAPLPPADSLWSMPPVGMAFQDRSPAELCEQLKDRSVNGGRGFIGLAEHVEEDHLLLTSWHSGRTTPPISHPELVERFQTWGAAGGPCPTR
mgnify:CR=1 FL=1